MSSDLAHSLFYVTFFFWVFVFLRSLLFWVYLWQLKEYRWDRMKFYLKTRTGKRILGSPIRFINLFLLLSYFILNGTLFVFLVLSVYFCLAIYSVFLFLRGSIQYPVWTFKSGVLSLLTWGIGIALMLAFPASLYFVIFDLSFPVVLGVIILLLQPVTRLFLNRYIQLAASKIQKQNNLKVIGITGSYGKSTTKEYLEKILSTHYFVLKTPKNVNTEIGVAKIVMENLKSAHEIFIVEMGAYKKGEIKSICDLVKPKLGILTGIGTQHLALFGNLKNIIETKFELIESLPKSGVAVLNADNPFIWENRTKGICSKILYSTQKKQDFYAKGRVVQNSSILFDLYFKNEKHRIRFNALGIYNVSNLLAAIAVALELGLSMDKIKEGIAGIQPLSQTMKPYPGINGSLIIDDSYNANTEGVIQSIEYLSHYPGKKILLISGVMELGDKQTEDHIKIGQKIGEIVDIVFIVHPDFERDLIQGIHKTPFDPKKIYTRLPFKEIARQLQQVLQKGDVVLLEGRGPGKLLQSLKYEK